MSEETSDYNVIPTPAEATGVTAIPYTEGTEYRAYSVDGEELPLFLQRLSDPQIAEEVVDVSGFTPEAALRKDD